MNDYEALLKMHEDADLNELKDRIDEKERISRIISNIRNRRHELDAELDKAARILAMEKLDVEQLRKMSVRNFVLSVTGKKGDMLDKEISEADEAAARYKAIQANMALLDEEIEKLKKQSDALGNCKTEYKLAYEARKKKILEIGGTDAESILLITDRLDYLKSQLKEVKEALDAGQRAFRSCDNAYKFLTKTDKADAVGASIGLLVAPGLGRLGLLAGAAAGDAVFSGTTNQLVEDMMRKLERFTAEIEDVKLNSEMVSGDSLFPLMYVTEEPESINQALYVINKANRMLELKKAALESEIKENDEKIDSIIQNYKR